MASTQPNSPETRLIHCANCNRRAASYLHICPTCGATLTARRFPLVLPTLVIIVIGALYLSYPQWLEITDTATGQVVNLISPPTATPTPTPTSTATLTPLPTATPTLTSTPTVTPSPTRTPTPTIQTATAETGTPTATASQTPTSTTTLPATTPTATNTPAPTRPRPTPTPTVRFDSLTIIGPADGEHFEKNKPVVLEWIPVGPLGDNEWYAIRMYWSQGETIAYGGTNIQETFWIVPVEQYFGLANASPSRVYNWHVLVEKEIINPNGNRATIPISVQSETRSFIWE